MWHALSRPDVYRAAIDRLIRGAEHGDDGEIALLQRERGELARRLARDMAARRWTQQPVRRGFALLDKRRELVKLDTVDKVVHGAVGAVLSRELERVLPASLYSYRRGRGPGHVVHAVRALLRSYRRRPVPLTERGLFVVRFDVAAYGDSLPVGPDSELWTMLRDALPGEDPWLLDTIAAMIRCDAGAAEPRQVGVPTGSPIANPVVNLYLVDLDRELEAIAALYLRFGDDCLVICETAEAAAHARGILEATLARKRLRVNPGKLLARYWNAAGRPGPAGWRGASHVSYVGADIAFSGTVRAKLDRRKACLDAIRARIAAIGGLLGPRDGTAARARAAALCASLAPAFDPASALAVPEVAHLMRLSSCRTQLAEMDHAIAIAVAGEATGRRGPAAFRALPWRTLHELGLPSLVRMRNQGHR